MTSIQALSDELISQIAAGEVVERPASVVKELVENSLDAKARQIRVEIEEGGLKSILVTDNGNGIAKDEVKMAFQRHATSKLRSVEDLFNIRSLGFRGEALASIASTARVLMSTRHVDSRIGHKLEMDGGKTIGFEEVAMENGTSIRVLGLFHHTPARKKFMKSLRTEYGHCFDWLSQIALAHPEVGFSLKQDGMLVFDLAPGQSLKERIRAIYGGSTVEALIPVQCVHSQVQISGFLGKPELARKSKKYQFLFVNGRAIESRLIHQAVRDAFHSLLMHEKHPWYVLDLKIDPSLLDVNVHPRKTEIKFVNSQEVFSLVKGACLKALEGHFLAPSLQPNTKFFVPQAGYSNPQVLSLDLQSFDAPQFDSPQKDTLFEIQGLMLRPVAQIALSYIVAESEEGLVLVDQHAAHERVRYAMLMEALEQEKPLVQPLLTPIELDLGLDGTRLLKTHLSDFEALGFELEHFGGSTFLMRSVPLHLSKRNPEEVFNEILADISQDQAKAHVKDVREYILTSTACRGAIKFGDPLTLTEMQALLRDMEGTRHSSHCPHGRPALITLNFDQLESLFKRKNF